MDRAVIERCLRAAHLVRQTDRLVRRHQAVFWLFGGLWVNVSGRRQPRDGATHAEPVFPTKREVATEGGAAGTPWWLRRSCHSTQLASQQCTQMPQNGSERPDPPICVHYCDPKATHNPSLRRNSVHKCPKTAPRGHFHRFVYTPASSPWR